MRKVAIIGIGQTPVDEHWDKSLRELAGEALIAAMQDANQARSAPSTDPSVIRSASWHPGPYALPVPEKQVCRCPKSSWSTSPSRSKSASEPQVRKLQTGPVVVAEAFTSLICQ